MRPCRNPADLLGLGRDPGLSRLLRACGAPEACLTGMASDYDQFLALAEALPLCWGHPLRAQVNAALSAALEREVFLCPHTAHVLWDAWVRLHLYGEGTAAASLPAVCPNCGAPSPRILSPKDICPLPDPCMVQADSLGAWSDALAALLPASLTAGEGDGDFAALLLPEDYAFVRPDPYRAGLAVGKVAAGTGLTARERDLLLTQSLRVWGLASFGGTILLQGGRPDAVVALLEYLRTAKALPSLVWIPRNPADAGAVSGLYTGVGTGFAEDDGDARAVYASAAPIGCAVMLP